MIMNREVVVNLWYVKDENDIIYSLRAKAYVCDGSDEEKIAFLQKRAGLDYLIAQPFQIPKQYHITIGAGRDAKRMPVAHVTAVEAMGGMIVLFEDALKSLESRMPVQSDIGIPNPPLVCLTPLMQNRDGKIEPCFDGQVRY
jgi:hypothetical protein